VSSRKLGLLSVVAPMLDESEVAREFCRRVGEALAGIEYELIVVDDGSTDGTAELLDELAAADDRLQVVHLSRTFGHQLALTAGLDLARGDAAVMMDADLQDPPEVIPKLIEAWRDGSNVVIARRRHRPGESRFKLLSARWFYAVMGRLAQVTLEPDAGDFRLLDRQALEALRSLRERSRFLRGMTAWVGFRQVAVEYDREPRVAGSTKFPLRRMLRFAVDGVASFSHFPLQIATIVGLVTTAAAFIGLPLTVVARYTGIYERGVPSVLFAVLFIGGIQLMTLGLIGEYVGRIYEEVKRRPLYVVRDAGRASGPSPEADGGCAAQGAAAGDTADGDAVPASGPTHRDLPQ
jgi:polyisoprenyl-phosphate glycosyltransferase